jgi:hypothetical protein
MRTEKEIQREVDLMAAVLVVSDDFCEFYKKNGATDAQIVKAYIESKDIIMKKAKKMADAFR